jgi:hypothetical protein
LHRVGSKRGEPPAREAHAALLVRFEGKAGGFIVQGGPSPVAGTARMACTGWVIPSADPDRDFTRAVGAFWGEDTVARELPTRTLATFTVSGLDEAHLRALVKELIAELPAVLRRLFPSRIQVVHPVVHPLQRRTQSDTLFFGHWLSEIACTATMMLIPPHAGCGRIVRCGERRIDSCPGRKYLRSPTRLRLERKS